MMMRLIRLFLILVSVSGFSPSAFAQSSAWCRPEKAPSVSVKSNSDKIKWDFTKSQSDLNKLEIDTVNPYGQNVITDVGGLMQGGIQMSETMKIGKLTNPNTREVCMYFGEVDISFHITPTIYIANEHRPGSCMHDVIKQHEMKHINEDIRIVNKYARHVGQVAQREIKRKWIYGPVPLAQEASLQAEMKRRLEGILLSSSKTMDTERRQRQQAIDNIKEYERVNSACRGR